MTGHLKSDRSVRQGSTHDTADTNPVVLRRRYEHDCASCVFLGQQGADDVYYCQQGTEQPVIPTVIFRFGDDGPDYRSGWHLRATLSGPLEARLKTIRSEH